MGSSNFLKRACARGKQSTLISRTNVRSFSAFVSKHFVVDKSEIENVVAHMKTEYRLRPDGAYDVKQCKLCTKGNRSKVDNLWKLTIRENGSAYCYRCSHSMSWFELKQKVYSTPNIEDLESTVNDIDDAARNVKVTLEKREPSVPQNKETILPKEGEAEALHLALFPLRGGSRSPEAEEVLRYLTETRGLSEWVLRKYRVGYGSKQFLDDAGNWIDTSCVVFSWFQKQQMPLRVIGDGGHASIAGNTMDENKTSACVPVRIKYRAVKTKGQQRLAPKGGQWGFFGWDIALMSSMKSHVLNADAAPDDSTEASSHSGAGFSEKQAIIVTEGEYDAMAVAQGLAALSDSHPLRWVPAISLPNGCGSLPTDLLPLLEPFKRVYLWMDNDKPGQDGAEKFAQKIGKHRCWLVRPRSDMDSPPKDANDALRQCAILQSLNAYISPISHDSDDGTDGVTVDGHLASGNSTPTSTANSSGYSQKIRVLPSSPYPASNRVQQNLISKLIETSLQPTHHRIETFSELRQRVLSGITTARIKGHREGTQTPSIDDLGKIAKGFRRGELIVCTGPTGGGKTTLLSQLSVDFAKAGAPTLWGSFEIKNVRLVQKMLQQYAGYAGDITQIPLSSLNKLADDFESLPIRFMNFHGSTDVTQILDAMDFAVYRDDVQHIIIDNLQFMTPKNQMNRAGSTSFEKLALQDEVIDHMRRFATEKNVNVILVIHPRKEDDLSVLGLSSISGTAKATQESDLVFILQKRRQNDGLVKLDVAKNRFDGTLGSVFLAFNSSSCLFRAAVPAVDEPRRLYTPKK